MAAPSSPHLGETPVSDGTFAAPIIRDGPISDGGVPIGNGDGVPIGGALSPPGGNGDSIHHFAAETPPAMATVSDSNAATTTTADTTTTTTTTNTEANFPRNSDDSLPHHAGSVPVLPQESPASDVTTIFSYSTTPIDSVAFAAAAAATQIPPNQGRVDMDADATTNSLPIAAPQEAPVPPSVADDEQHQTSTLAAQSLHKDGEHATPPIPNVVIPQSIVARADLETHPTVTQNTPNSITLGNATVTSNPPATTTTTATTIATSTTITSTTTDDISATASLTKTHNRKDEALPHNVIPTAPLSQPSIAPAVNSAAAPVAKATAPSDQTRLPSSPEFVRIANMYYAHSQKFYYCGFVYKKNELGDNGKPIHTLANFSTTSNASFSDKPLVRGEWSKWWMELWGPVLQLWRVPDEIAEYAYASALSPEKFIAHEIDPSHDMLVAIKSAQPVPVYINIADVVSEIFPNAFMLPSPQPTSPTSSSDALSIAKSSPRLTLSRIPQQQRPPQPPPSSAGSQSQSQSPLSQTFLFSPSNPPPIPYTSFFAFSNTGSNLYIFACASPYLSNIWVAAIRLVGFELQKLHQMFTYKLLAQSRYLPAWEAAGIAPFETHSFRGEIRFEGPLQVRLTYTTQWKPYHVVVTSRVGTDATSAASGNGPARFTKKLFGKKSPVLDFSKRGTILFYESKSDAKKGRPPVFTMDTLRSITAVWPEKPDLIDMDLVCMAKLEGVINVPPSTLPRNNSSLSLDSDDARGSSSSLSSTSSSPSIQHQQLQQPTSAVSYSSASSASSSSRATAYTATLGAMSPFQQSPATNTLTAYASGYPSISTPVSIRDLVENTDTRPPPYYLHILAQTTQETAKWITHILAAFSLDADREQLENEVMEIDRASSAAADAAEAAMRANENAKAAAAAADAAAAAAADSSQADDSDVDNNNDDGASADSAKPSTDAITAEAAISAAAAAAAIATAAASNAATQLPWPTALFLSVGEISGLSMTMATPLDTQIQFAHYFSQKLVFSRQNKLRVWCESTAKGEWERGLAAHRDMDSKIRVLFEWVEFMRRGLVERGFAVPDRVGFRGKRDLNEGDRGSLERDVRGRCKDKRVDKSTAAVTAVTVATKTGSAHAAGKKSSLAAGKSASKAISNVNDEDDGDDEKEDDDDDDNEGSVSEEENSDEGSQSEADETDDGDPKSSESSRPLSYYLPNFQPGALPTLQVQPSPLLGFQHNQIGDNDPNNYSDDMELEELKKLQVYSRNSLLAQVAEQELNKPNINRLSVGGTYLTFPNKSASDSVLLPLGEDAPLGLIQQQQQQQQQQSLQAKAASQRLSVGGTYLNLPDKSANDPTAIPHGDSTAHLGLIHQQQQQQQVRPVDGLLLGPIEKPGMYGANVGGGLMQSARLDRRDAGPGGRYSAVMGGIGMGGPLLGNVAAGENKPKLEGGLLGEMNRREKEREYLKRLGYKPTASGGAGGPGGNHPGMSSASMYPPSMMMPMMMMPAGGGGGVGGAVPSPQQQQQPSMAMTPNMFSPGMYTNGMFPGMYYPYPYGFPGMMGMAPMGMSPMGMSPMGMGMGMPPMGMPPMGMGMMPPAGMGWPIGPGGADAVLDEDPATAQHREYIRQQWLEMERAKERQRAAERMYHVGSTGLASGGGLSFGVGSGSGGGSVGVLSQRFAVGPVSESSGDAASLSDVGGHGKESSRSSHSEIQIGRVGSALSGAYRGGPRHPTTLPDGDETSSVGESTDSEDHRQTRSGTEGSTSDRQQTDSGTESSEEDDDDDDDDMPLQALVGKRDSSTSIGRNIKNSIIGASTSSSLTVRGRQQQQRSSGLSRGGDDNMDSGSSEEHELGSESENSSDGDDRAPLGLVAASATMPGASSGVTSSRQR